MALMTGGLKPDSSLPTSRIDLRHYCDAMSYSKVVFDADGGVRLYDSRSTRLEPEVVESQADGLPATLQLQEDELSFKSRSILITIQDVS